jgi:hypothetical protein
VTRLHAIVIVAVGGPVAVVVEEVAARRQACLTHRGLAAVRVGAVGQRILVVVDSVAARLGPLFQDLGFRAGTKHQARERQE